MQVLKQSGLLEAAGFPKLPSDGESGAACGHPDSQVAPLKILLVLPGWAAGLGGAGLTHTQAMLFIRNLGAIITNAPGWRPASHAGQEADVWKASGSKVSTHRGQSRDVLPQGV